VTADGEWNYALCAPGDQLNAEMRLLLGGVRVREVREHPWLTCLRPGEVVLMRDPWPAEPPFPLGFGAR
jgi:hypothetical protein